MIRINAGDYFLYFYPDQVSVYKRDMIRGLQYNCIFSIIRDDLEFSFCKSPIVELPEEELNKVKILCKKYLKLMVFK